MTLSYSRYFLIVAFAISVFALTPLVTLAGGGGGGGEGRGLARPDAAVNVTDSGVVCPADAKMCPDGSFVGRVAPSCNFAACPTGTSTPPTDSNRCPQDAKMCPNGTFVGRTGPNCQFAACSNGTAAIGIDQPGPGSSSNSSGAFATDSAVNTETYAACPRDAKVCPNGATVGRVGPNCQFAACPTSPGTSSNNNAFATDSGVCPQDARMCPDGSFVSRTGPNCQFAACGTGTAAIGTDQPGPGSSSNWSWPFFAGSTGSDSGISASTVLGPVTGAISYVAPMMGPTFSGLSAIAQFGPSLFDNGETPGVASYTNFGAINMPTFSGNTVAHNRSTSTLQTLLDRIYKRNQTNTNNNSNATSSPLTSGGTKPNATNNIMFESKVVSASSTIISDWSTSTVMSVPKGAQLHLRWTASDYTQCLPAFNDNGRYALQAGRYMLRADDYSMTIGNTEDEGYDLPEVSGNYSIECGGQKNDEKGVDRRSVKVSGPGTVVPPLFGGPNGVPGAISGGTISNDGTVTGDDPSIPPPVACTMDAKICPDGSSVGRIGPSCQFAPCPTADTDYSAINTYEKCVAAGYPVQEMNPPRCVLPNGTVYVKQTTSGNVCTQEAKRCPDGSYVTRTGPSCAFAACPTSGASNQ